MIRKLCFGFVLLTAFIVAACGRQVTPNPPGVGAGGALPGQMAILFDVAAPFNFQNYQYWIIFNTTGNGLTPDTRPFVNNWAAYSTGIEVYGSGGTTSARAGQFLKNSNPAIPPTFLPFSTPPQLFQYNANSNGTGTEFSIIFSREIFTSFNSPSPAPTGTTTPPPFARVWTFNAFATQANTQGQFVFVDSMGPGGPVDPQYVCCNPTVNITQKFDSTYYALSSALQIDPPAQIESVTLGNNP